MSALDKKIAVLLPYDELIDFSKQIAEKLKIEIIIKKINSENAIKIAKECCNDGVNIIISRGNLAIKIQENVDIEVVAVSFTGYDFLDSLYKYKEFKQPIGIIENKYIISGCKEINRHLNLDLHYYPVADVENFSEKTMEAINDGMQLLIGGSWGIEIRKFLKNYDITYEMIRSKKVSIEHTINQAVSMLTKKLQKDNNMEIINTVSEFAELGIIVVNSSNRITNINKIAKAILRISGTAIIGEKISILIPQLNFYSILENKKRIFDKKIFLHDNFFLLDAIPILQNEETNGIVVFIKSLKEQNKNIKINSLVGATQNSDILFDFIINNSDYYTNIRNIANCYAKTDQNILITGEFGTGKKSLAKYIYKHSPRSQNSFTAIDCEIDLDTLENIFPNRLVNTSDHEKSLVEYNNNGILFLENIDKLSFSMQNKIVEFLKFEVGQERKNNKFNIKFIASTDQNLSQAVAKGTFNKKLFYFLNGYHLKSKSVNDSKDFKLYIIKTVIDYEMKLQPELNITISKKIIDKLLECKWDGNIIEIQNCIKKILVLVNENISDEDILEEITSQFKIDSNTLYIDSVKLHDIEQKAICDAIMRNNGNKTKASAELGIDRTTLNRKLKIHEVK